MFPDVLTELARRGLTLSVHGNKLRCHGDVDAVPAALIEALRRQRKDVLRYIALGAGTEAQRRPVHDPSLTRAPLCNAQLNHLEAMGLWQFAERSLLDPHGFEFEIPGEIDSAVVREAYSGLGNRHAALRTAIHRDGDGRLEQHIDGAAPPLRIIDLDRPDLDLPGRHACEAFRRVAAEVLDFADVDPRLRVGREWNYCDQPLVRAAWVRLSPLGGVFLLAVDHVVADGYSLPLLYRDFALLLEAARAGRPAALPERPIDYPDYCTWEASRDGEGRREENVAYWEHCLDGEIPPTRLPNDGAFRPEDMAHGEIMRFRLDPGLARGIFELSRRHSVTVFAILLSAFSTTLAELLKTSRVSVFVLFANRQALVRNVVGMFTRIGTIQVTPEECPSFPGLVELVQGRLIQANAHIDVRGHRIAAPGHALQSEADFGLGTPFTISMENYLDQRVLGPVKIPFTGAAAGTGRTFEAAPIDDHTIYVRFIPDFSGQALWCWMHYCTRSTRRETMEGVGDAFLSVLERLNHEEAIAG